MSTDRNVPKIEIFSVEVQPDQEFHRVPIFGIEIVANDNSSWCEAFATKAEVDAFLRGFQAGSQMTGGPYIPLPYEVKKREVL